MTLKRMLLWAALLPGCAHVGDVELRPEAKLMLVGFATPSVTCQNLGPVMGNSNGGSLTLSNVHSERALADARNRAAALGANYLQAQQPQLRMMQFGPVGATVMGVAYRCPPGTPEAQAWAASYAPVQAQQDAEARAHAKEEADVERANEKAPGDGRPVTSPKIHEQKASYAARAKELALAAPSPPIKLDHVELDDVQVVRAFPDQPCTPVGASEVTASDRSLVRAVTTLRKNAVDRRANLVVLDPVDEQAPQLVVLGRYYACPR